MIKLFFTLSIICGWTISFSFQLDKICDKYYDNCALKSSSVNFSYIGRNKQCPVEYLPKDVVFHIMSDEKNSSSRGVVSVSFISPEIPCSYQVALFVNSSIKNDVQCKNHIFHGDNHAEVHTLEKLVCPSLNLNTKIINKLETEPHLCKKNIYLWYEYIYTGCYALGFKVGNSYTFVGHEYFMTEYHKTDVTDAKLQCHYKTNLPRNSSSLDIVEFKTDVSLDIAGTSTLKLFIRPIFLEHKKENDFCSRLSESPVISDSFVMKLDSNTDTLNKNCSLSTLPIQNGDLVKTLECNYAIQKPASNFGYCYLIRILDVRCFKNSSWNPPIKNADEVPCTWTQQCIKTDFFNKEIKAPEEDEVLQLISTKYLAFIGATLISILIVSSIILLACKAYLLQRKNYFANREKRNMFKNEPTAVLELNENHSPAAKLLKETGIVLLYAKETDAYMSFMTEFKKSLKQCTGYCVFDWWSPELWNEVARYGGYEWAMKMIKDDYRIVWMDTLKSRSLINKRHKNGHNKMSPWNYSCDNQDISDFRDNVFPAIIEFAKRNNQNLEKEYQRHFVVRLETFMRADKTEDPFADISPHARYLIPRHLEDLCSQLMSDDLYTVSSINAEKSRLEACLGPEFMMKM